MICRSHSEFRRGTHAGQVAKWQPHQVQARRQLLTWATVNRHPRTEPCTATINLARQPGVQVHTLTLRPETETPVKRKVVI